MRGMWLHSCNLATEDSSTIEELVFLFKHCQSKIATDIPQERELGPMSKIKSLNLPSKKKKTRAIYLGHFIFNHSLLNDLNIPTSILNDKFCNPYE